MSRVVFGCVLLAASVAVAGGPTKLMLASDQLRDLVATGQFKLANNFTADTVRQHLNASPVELARFELLHARLLMFTRYGESAADIIERAAVVAEKNNHAGLKADLLATRARYLTSRKEYDRAIDQYALAIKSYSAMKSDTDAAKVAAEGMRLAARQRPEKLEPFVTFSAALLKRNIAALNELVRDEKLDVYDARQNVPLLLAALAETTSVNDPAGALQQWTAVAEMADEAKDPHTVANAWAQIASIYDQNNQPADALVAARRGLFIAQNIGAEETKFRLDWQIARLQRKENKPDEAIDSYFRSVRALQNVRHDLLIHLARSGAAGTFRQNIGPVYYQLADLLIRRSENKPDTEQQADLRLARQVVEQLKSAELEDYFQDECVNLAREQERIVDVDLQNTAVIYLIPLADRTEILISTPGGRIERVTSSATDSQISQTARQFRFDITNRRNAKYLQTGKQLYDWVIAPIVPTLQKAGSIDTLVFVPDGELRTVPMAALHDGEKFLVEKYALAISPGLTLMRPEPLHRTGKPLQVLKGGVTIERKVGNTIFAALPNVNSELDEIQKFYPGVMLKDEGFRNAQIEQRLEQDAFTIVHIASHGQFKPEARDTFILTYDSTLNLDQLERLMMPSRFRERPIELLTLSACQTAAGDEGARAALGMAGIAVKAGARSAMATLWFVSDEASSELVGKFYQELSSDPTTSRSESLRRAQRKVLENDRFCHPYYWAPFLMIGNWK